MNFEASGFGRSGKTRFGICCGICMRDLAWPVIRMTMYMWHIKSIADIDIVKTQHEMAPIHRLPPTLAPQRETFSPNQYRAVGVEIHHQPHLHFPQTSPLRPKASSLCRRQGHAISAAVLPHSDRSPRHSARHELRLPHLTLFGQRVRPVPRMPVEIAPHRGSSDAVQHHSDGDDEEGRGEGDVAVQVGGCAWCPAPTTATTLVRI